jgi:hypothetical protein
MPTDDGRQVMAKAHIAFDQASIIYKKRNPEHNAEWVTRNPLKTGDQVLRMGKQLLLH